MLGTGGGPPRTPPSPAKAAVNEMFGEVTPSTEWRAAWNPGSSPPATAPRRCRRVGLRMRRPALSCVYREPATKKKAAEHNRVSRARQRKIKNGGRLLQRDNPAAASAGAGEGAGDAAEAGLCPE